MDADGDDELDVDEANPPRSCCICRRWEPCVGAFTLLWVFFCLVDALVGLTCDAGWGLSLRQVLLAEFREDAKKGVGSFDILVSPSTEYDPPVPDELRWECGFWTQNIVK